MKLDCRYILLSYNNNGKKLQVRSNAKMTDEEIVDTLSKRGEVKVLQQIIVVLMQVKVR